MHIKYLTTLILWAIDIAECQFLYPVDPNPIENPLTFDCFTCHSEDNATCGNVQSSTDNQESCTGIRIGCWISLDVDTGVYERGCIQPSSVRQGVFCNRHIDGKEFCYYDGNSKNGDIKKCHKCCLSDSCNDGILEGKPDETLQSCVRCDGKNDERCNQGDQEFEDELTEQCLMPNSDCWKAKSLLKNEVFYTRGCQISVCDDRNVEEQCTTTRNTTVCTKCCRGANECNFGLLEGGGQRVVPSILWRMIVVMFLTFFL